MMERSGKLVGALIRWALCASLCTPAPAAAGTISRSLEDAAAESANADRSDSLGAAWGKAGASFEATRGFGVAVDATGSPAERRTGASGPEAAGSPGRVTLHATVPPVPGSGRVTLRAEDDKEAAAPKKKAPPPDDNAVMAASGGMLVGAILGFMMLGGPIGLCVGLVLGAFGGALLSKGMGMFGGGEEPEAPPAPPANPPAPPQKPGPVNVDPPPAPAQS